jgi:hypothetical protein
LLVRVFEKGKRAGRWASALLVTGSWALSLAFFRAQSFADAGLVLNQIFTWATVETAVEPMSDEHHQLTVVLLLFLILIEGIVERWGKAADWLSVAPRPFRWVVYVALAWGIILLGVHGLQVEDKQFIYFQF